MQLNYKKTFLSFCRLIVSGIVSTSSIVAQVDMLTQHKPNFETYRIRDVVEDDNISYSGTLSFAIPLIVVPGRHGNDFAIKLNYNSTIGQRQTASWVGLGWNLNVGYLERTVVGRLDDQTGAQFPEGDAGNNLGADASNGNWRAEMVGRLTGSHNTLPIKDKDQVDIYQLNVDGSSIELLPFGTTLDNDPAAYPLVNGLPVDNFQTFLPLEYKPWKIEGNKDQSGHFFSSFFVIKEDGTQLNYGMTPNGISWTDVSGKSKNPNPIYNQEMLFPYRWSLTNIVYADGSNTTITYNKTPRDERPFESVSIDRSTDVGDESKNFFGAGAPTWNFDKGRVLKDYSYPDNITTDIYKLVFISSATTDNSECSRRLDAIVLYDLSSNTEVKRIEFVYASVSNNGSSSTAWVSNTKLNNNQLTLTGIRQVSGTNHLPSYQFSYYGNPKVDPADLETSPYGYYGGTGFEYPWRLSNMVIPTGATINYVYENFLVQYDPEGLTSGLWNTNAEPKVRLKIKTITDPLGATAAWTYTYSEAIYDGPSRPIGINYWPQYCQRSYPLSDQWRFYRGCPVGHRWVRVSNSTGYYRKVFFTSSYKASGCDPKESFPDVIDDPDPLVSGHVLIASLNPMRGLPWKIETPSESKINHYSFESQGTFDDRYEYYQVNAGLRNGLTNYSSFWVILDSCETIKDNVTFKDLYFYGLTPRWTLGSEFPGNGLIDAKTELSGSKRRTYAYQYAYSYSQLMFSKNMLSQLYSTSVIDTRWVDPPPSGQQQGPWHPPEGSWQDFPQEKKWTIWGQNTNNTSIWLPKEEWVWRSTSSDLTAPDYPSNAVAVKVKSYDLYDAQSNLLQSSDANGHATFYYYGSNANPFDNSDNSLNHAFLTGIKDVAGVELKQSYKYNNAGRVIEHVDENNISTYFEYDDFQRLLRTKDNTGTTISENTYCYSRELSTSENFDATKPNLVSTAKYFNGNLVKNWSFEDPLVSGSPKSWDGSGQVNELVNDSYFGSRAVKVYHGGSNSSIDQGIGILKSGHTYSVSVWFKAQPGIMGQLFFGDAADSPHDNYETKYVNGNGQWQQMSVSHTMSHDDIMYLYLYGYGDGGAAGDYVIYDNIIVEDAPQASAAYVSSSFLDGQGRLIQTQNAVDYTNDIVQNTTYDAGGRTTLVSKPYQYTTHHHYDAASNVNAHAAGYYNANVYFEGFSDPSPYVSYDYYADGRVQHLKPPGEVFKNNNHFLQYSYGANAENEVDGYQAGTLFKTVELDENQKQKINYVDAFGNSVRSVVVDPAVSDLKTSFTFDIQGRITKTTPPKGDAYSTTYEYNTEGQLTQKTSPDAGTVKYLYDKAGNLRFIQDANHGASGTYVYRKYDSVNRLVEEGNHYVPDGSFTQGYADISNSPTSGNFRRKLMYYDLPSYADQHNLTGRLSNVMSCNTAAQIIQWIYYSYRNDGLVEWIRNIPYPSGGVKQISYWYDLQGNITKKGFIDYGEIGNTLYTFYEYDQAGRLSKVYSSQDVNGAAKIKEAEYTYFASGKIKRLQLGNAQGMDYRYNERDWLAAINHQNLNTWYNGAPQDPGGDGYSGIPGDKFGEVIGYNVINQIGAGQSASAQYNGNISWLMYNMAGVNYSGSQGTTPLLGWTYHYDNSNRLTSADFGYYADGWKPTNAYDLNNNQYDKNGNITLLQRRDRNGEVLNSLHYDYASNTNRLTQLIDDAGAALDFDFSYDANGNMTSGSYRSISSVAYDYNNLPATITRTGYPAISYWYDSNGNRIRKQQGSTDEYYVLGADGQTEAVYTWNGGLKFWNIIAGGQIIGRVEKP